MTTAPKTWFERKFSFADLEGTFPTILERLKDAPMRYENKIHNTPKDHWKKIVANKWSIQEQLGHIVDLESLWLKRAHNFKEGKKVLEEADLTNQKTYDADHNNTDINVIMDDFKHKRLQLISLLSELSPISESQTALHPRLKSPMRLIDLMYFVAEHDDHHLALISWIQSKLK